ncbi:hypothetical protein Q3G72_002069 [Acer saccharum]|nr:hypothetical protein Q3G72_002069 [Acer saccharum]
MEKLGEVVVVLIRKFSRNRLLFGGDCVEQGNFWDRVGKLAKEFRRDGIGVSVPKVCGSGSLGWILPNSGDFKLNIDAALDYDNCRYGAGMVIRDDKGIVVVAVALSFFGKVSMDITEAKAILEAHFAVLNGCSNVWSNVFPDWLSVLAKADLSSCNPSFGK